MKVGVLKKFLVVFLLLLVSMAAVSVFADGSGVDKTLSCVKVK